MAANTTRHAANYLWTSQTVTGSQAELDHRATVVMKTVFMEAIFMFFSKFSVGMPLELEVPVSLAELVKVQHLCSKSTSNSEKSYSSRSKSTWKKLYLKYK